MCACANYFAFAIAANPDFLFRILAFQLFLLLFLTNHLSFSFRFKDMCCIMLPTSNLTPFLLFRVALSLPHLLHTNIVCTDLDFLFSYSVQIRFNTTISSQNVDKSVINLTLPSNNMPDSNVLDHFESSPLRSQTSPSATAAICQELFFSVPPCLRLYPVLCFSRQLICHYARSGIFQFCGLTPYYATRSLTLQLRLKTHQQHSYLNRDLAGINTKYELQVEL